MLMNLTDLCEVFTDGDWIESKDQSKDGIRLIQTGNIGIGQFIEKDDKAKYISIETFERLKCTEVFEGDILVSRLPDPIGRACIVPNKTERMITAVDCTICRPKADIIDREYLCYFMQSKTYYERLFNNVTGTTRKRISRKNLGNVEIYVPSKEEQKIIVKKLNLLTKIISNRTKELSYLDNLIKARFVEMFGSLNNTSYKTLPLGDVCEFIKDGTHQTPTYTEDKVRGFKFLSSKDVTSQKISWSNIKYIPESLHNELYSKLAPKRGDILLAKNGTTGVAAVVDTDEVFDIYVSLALLRPKLGYNSQYLWAVINSNDTKMQFNANLKGIGVPNLHLGEIKKAKVIVPPLEQQTKFADFLEQIDKSKVAVQKSLEETQLLFDKLMQEYFG